MATELDQAAERLRRYRADGNFEAAYAELPTHRERYAQWEFDCELLIDAYLAGQRGVSELKPLEWEHPNPRLAIGRSSLVVYDISENCRGVCYWSLRTLDVTTFHECDSIDDGKAKCEADYRHRVAGLYVGGTPS